MAYVLAGKYVQSCNVGPPNVGPPNVISWLTKAPITMVINTINHSDIGVFGVICTKFDLIF